MFVRSTQFCRNSSRAFTLVELLVVIAIVVILTAVSTALVPSLLKGDQTNSGINTLTGILEEAREAAMAGNTYVWVAFTDQITANPAAGFWVATIQSVDGTETNVNTSSTTTPTWATSLTIPSTTYPNLQIHSKIQNIPGLWLDTTSGFSKVPSTLVAKAPSSTLSTPLATVTPGWNVTPLANTAAGSGVYFKYVIEFTPNGEAHVPNWSNNIQLALYPSIGSNKNSVLFNVSRLTGKTTVYRM